jgi:leucyl-tRNA synthetase
VQLNGKTLKKVTVLLSEAAGEDEAREAALGLAAVAQRLDGRPVKKLIYVPGRIVNIIA